jgi:hypothetical protein
MGLTEKIALACGWLLLTGIVVFPFFITISMTTAQGLGLITFALGAGMAFWTLTALTRR